MFIILKSETFISITLPLNQQSGHDACNTQHQLHYRLKAEYREQKLGIIPQKKANSR